MPVRDDPGTGDVALRFVASRLETGLRGNDVAGRIGGEEFVVLFDGLGHTAAVDAADRLRTIVGAEPLVAGGGVLSVSVSGGVATYPDDGLDWDRLLNLADRRLYAAKLAGRDRIMGADGLFQDERPMVSHT